MFSEAHLGELKAAVRRRQLVVVAGAGVSCGAGLPLWDELVRTRMPSFLRKFGEEGAKVADQVAGVADFPMHAAGIWWDWIDRNEGLERIDRFFAETFPVETKPTATHERIVRLCMRAGPCVATTNFDLLFERCPGSTLIVRTQFDSTLGYALTSATQGRKFLLKLHGTVGSVDSLVLTARQYGQQSTRKNHGAFWDAIQLSHVLLFVGYGGRDPDLDELRQQLVDRFEGNISSVYMLLDRPDQGLREALRRARVVIAEFNGSEDGYGVIDELLETLLEVADEDGSREAPVSGRGVVVVPRLKRGRPSKTRKRRGKR